MKVTSEIKAAVDEWFDARKDDIVRDLTRLIAQKSVYADAEPGAPYGADARAALDLSRDILQELGFSSVLFEDCMLETDWNVHYGETPRFGLLVHADTVAYNAADWVSDPLTADIRDGKLYGRGATDNKGPAIASFYAMAAARDVIKKLRLTATGGIRVITGSAEEIGCVDLNRYLKTNVPPQLCVAPDADYPLVNVEKGRFVMKFSASWDVETSGARVLSLSGGKTSNIVPHHASARLAGVQKSAVEALTGRFTNATSAVFTVKEESGETVISAFGAAAHASKPKDGNNAQTALLALLSALPLSDCASTRVIKSLAALFPHGETDGASLGIAANDDVSGALTLSFGVLELTETGFTADFDSRTPKASDALDLPGIVTGAFNRRGITADSHTRTHCHVADKDSPLVKLLLGIYETYTGQPGACLALGGTTYAHYIDGAVAFGCEMPGAPHGIHGKDEFIPLDVLFSCGKMLATAAIALTAIDN